MDDATLYRQIAHRIRQQRKARNMSQTALAERLNITRSSVANAETGRQRFPIHTLYRIATILECSPYDLLPDTVYELKPTSRVEWM